MELHRIFAHNRSWVEARLGTDPDYFTTLARGQSPEMLYIGCSDSRVTAEELMGVEPGQAFVLRNIANMVPNSDLGSQSVITYAVSHLKVKHIIVCGHYNCGGVHAAMQPADLGLLNPWLRNVRDVYRLHRDELDAIPDTQHRYNRLVELNVQEQCVNVIKTADVQKAWAKHRIQVHGWVFDVNTGLLKDLEIDFEKVLQQIMEIYKIV